MIVRNPEFEAMRVGLVARGLLSPEFALTEAGHAFVADFENMRPDTDLG